MGLLHQSTSVQLWHDLVTDAEKICDISLEQEVESYLVFLLIRYTTSPEVIQQIMGTDFLQGVQLSPKLREVALQNVGDKCLLFSGLFPILAKKRLVKISYFVRLGQSSYATISKSQNDIYGLLSHQFVALMDVLQSVKNHDLLPLDAYELWHETGSQRAYALLKDYSIHKTIKQ
ncbi:MAG TPA: hypothetical protein VHM20_04550 [Gammaproteobacteria bacterium]|nr:hypothetical protein [Gammaproteobacteria bacterium]